MVASDTERLTGYGECCEILQRIAATPLNLELGLSDLLRTICKYVDVDIIGHLEYTTLAGKSVVCSYQRGESKTEIGSLPRDVGLMAIVRKNQQIKWSSALQKEIGYLIHDASIVEEAALPILLGRRVCGIIDLASKTSGTFNHDDIEWLTKIVQLIGAIIVRPEIRLRTEMAQGKDIHDLSKMMLELALEVCGIEHGKAEIVVISDVRVLFDYTLEVSNGEFSDSQGFMKDPAMLRSIEEAVKRNSVFSTTEILVDDEIEFDRNASEYTEIAIPIYCNGLCIGVIGVASYNPIGFGTLEYLPLKLVVEHSFQLANFIRIEKQLEIEAMVIGQIAKLRTSKSLDLRLEFIFDSILSTAIVLVKKVNRAQIITLEYESSGKKSSLVVERYLETVRERSEGDFEYDDGPRTRGGEFPSNHRFKRFSVERGVSGAAISERRTRYVKDISSIDREKYIMLSRKTKSEAAIPFVVGNHAIGVLNIESDMLDAFSERDLEIGELLASVATEAILSSENHMETIEITSLGVRSLQNLLRGESQELVIQSLMEWFREVCRTNEIALEVTVFAEDGKVKFVRALDDANTMAKGRNPNARTRRSHAVVDYIEVPVIDQGGRRVASIKIEGSSWDERTLHIFETFNPVLASILAKSLSVSSLQEDIRAYVGRISKLIHDIKGPVDTLQSKVNDKALARASGKTLLGITRFIDMLLRLIRVEAEILRDPLHPMAPREVNVRDLVHQVVQGYEWFADFRRYTLVDRSGRDTDEERAVTIARSDEVEGAIVELLQNAIRFSDPGSTVVVTVDRLTDRIDIVVQDEGRGVLDDEVESIFEPRFRGSNVKDTLGSGMGLYFARTLIARQDGGQIRYQAVRVHVDGQHVLNSGSRFIIMLKPA